LSPGAPILDIGCGWGATVDFLSQNRFDAVGMDADPKAITGARLAYPASRFIVGQAEAPAFCDGSMEGILMECSLSQMRQPDRVLCECARILRPAGYLIISDLYSRKTGVEGEGRLETRTTLSGRFDAAGFRLLYWEDCTPQLHQTIGQLLLDGGFGDCRAVLGLDRSQLKDARCGYYMAVMQKRSQG
jgi:ubiquinone/menaquinone biosynthesis C-methylase UbiE